MRLPYKFSLVVAPFRVFSQRFFFRHEIEHLVRLSKFRNGCGGDRAIDMILGNAYISRQKALSEFGSPVSPGKAGSRGTQD